MHALYKQNEQHKHYKSNKKTDGYINENSKLKQLNCMNVYINCSH